MRRIRIFSLIIMFLMFIFSLSSCKMFKEMSEESQKITESFFEHIENDNYSMALTLIHKDSKLYLLDLKSEINRIETYNNVDFSSGVSILGVSNFELTGYTMEYNGSVSKMTYNAKIGYVDCQIYILIVDNQAGYCIYEFEIIK